MGAAADIVLGAVHEMELHRARLQLEFEPAAVGDVLDGLDNSYCCTDLAQVHCNIPDDADAAAPCCCSCLQDNDPDAPDAPDAADDEDIPVEDAAMAVVAGLDLGLGCWFQLQLEMGPPPRFA